MLASCTRFNEYLFQRVPFETMTDNVQNDYGLSLEIAKHQTVYTSII